MNTVFFSIITINLNNLPGLKKTCQSVFVQNFSSYEFIVIDGGSTDGSVDFLHEFNSKITYWVSERDGGIYSAMNKGIEKSCGVYLQFLNSGDSLTECGVLSNLYLFLIKNRGYDFYYSDVINSKTNKVVSYPRILTFNHFFFSTINHQSTFFKRELFLLYGSYSEYNKIVSDWELFLKLLFLHSCSYKFVDFPLVNFDFETGISTSNHSVDLIETERKRVLQNLFPHFISDYYQFNSILNSRTFKLINFLTSFKRAFRNR